MFKNKVSYLLFSFFIFVVVFSFAPKAFAFTTVTDDIAEDTTWTQNQGPYIVGDFVAVLPNATLTIEPGVVVKFDFNDGLYILGSIKVDGTSLEKVSFSSLYDSIGADLYNDCFEYIPDIILEEGVEQCANTNQDEIDFPWLFEAGEITISNTLNSSFQNVLFSHLADNGLSFFNASAVLDTVQILDSSMGIQAFSSNLSISNSIFRNIYNADALELYNNSSVEILNIEVKSSDYGGLALYGSKADIADSTFTGNGETGIETYSRVGEIYQSELNASDLKVSGYDSGLAFYGGTVYVEQTKLFQNYIGFEAYSSPNVTIVESSITGNAYASSVYSASIVNAINNYWGDSSGPFEINLNSGGLGGEIQSNGNIIFSPWLASNPLVEFIHNPVLIIPGVLGTEISKDNDKLWLDILRNITDIGDQFMDPLQFNVDLTPSDMSLTIGDVIRKETLTRITFDYTGGLIDEFQNQGYVEDTDLFLFSYDWRYGVSEDNINKLKQKIQDIKTQTGANEVDIVAHSTGGLLVKKYVIENSVNHYTGKAVFVGVPNTGAPKAIKTLLQGDSFGIPFLSDEEMKKIAKNLPVVYDLSPSQQYFNTKGSYVKIIHQEFFSSSSQDLDFNQANSFLTNDHNLNNQALINAQNLHTADFDNFDMRNSGVNLYSINGCKAGTISKVIERRVKSLLGGTLIGYQQPEESPGDGTVPLESATNLSTNQDHKYYALKANHAKMLSQEGIRQEIVNLISGSNLDVGDSLITQDISKCKLKGKAISVYSPLGIDITDQDGNHSGLVSDGIQNDIPNADFEIMGEHKFIYLPDDEGQIYTINIKGTGNGTFTFKNQDINDNQVTQTQVFSNIPVTSSLTGQINLGIITTLSLDNNGDGATDQTIQPSSIVDANKSQDLISPVSTLTIVGTIGQLEFYRSNVSVNLSVLDPVIPGQENQTSGVLKTVYKLDNDSSYTTYVNPVVVSSEGQHTLKFFSTDKAGNNETEQSIVFTVDKTTPELQVTFDLNTKNVIFSAQDVLDPHPTIITTSTSIMLKDNAGNTTTIPFSRFREFPTRLKLIYNKITRNGVTIIVPNTNIIYDWQEKKGILTDLDTKITIKGMEKYTFNYKKANNATIIREKKSSGIITTIKPGFVVVTVTTEGNGLRVNY